MSTVRADPKEIRKFQSSLRNFNRELELITGRLQQQLRTLGTSWQDAKYREFEAQMTDVLQAFKRYQSQSSDYLRYLDGKARPLEEYGGGG